MSSPRVRKVPSASPLPATAPEIYYDGGQAKFLCQASDGRWLLLSEPAIRRELKLFGVRPKPKDGEFVSDMDRAVSWLTLNCNVQYAAPLAGHHAGLIEEGGNKILVTESPKFVEPKAGPFPQIDNLLSGLFPEEEGIGQIQRVIFCAWLKVGLQSLYSGRRQPGQALALAGPADSGKTLLQILITHALGGRSARPYPYMSGRTGFNAELFAAEHLMIDDEQASRDPRTRAVFAASLKQFTVASGARCEAKYRTPIELRPSWRLTITVNDEPESLLVLPPITEDLADKIILLRVRPAVLPPTQTNEQREAFMDALLAEMPAFIHHVLLTPIPEELVSQRFGVRAFHHAEIIDALTDLAPEQRLLSLIDAVLFDAPLPEEWEGEAVDLERELMDHGRLGGEARRLLDWSNATGTYLGRLAKSLPARIMRGQRQKDARPWIILRRPAMSA